MIRSESSYEALFLFLKKNLYLLPFIVSIPIINYQIIWKEKFRAERLLSGPLMVEEHFINPLLLNKYLIDSFTTDKQVVVFGSSRSRQITLAPYLKKYTSFFNNGINGSVLKDFIHLYNLYRKRGMAPKVIILECSPWLLNKDYEKSGGAWPFYDNVMLYRIFKIYDLYSPIILQKSLKKIFNIGPQALLGGNTKYFPDGHKDFPKINEAIVLHNVSNQRAFTYIENFSEINEKLEIAFINFVKMMQSDGVRVIFFLPPYHPISYEKMSLDLKHQAVFKAQSFFIEIAKKYNIEVVGSYNPKLCGCEASLFFDHSHTYGYSTKNIFKNILNTL